MTSPDHLKITGPEDILSFIPHSLGYWPSNSVVAMTVQGTRLGATLRIDLPEPHRCRGPALAAFAGTVCDYLKADQEADGALVAIFSDSLGAGNGGGADHAAPAGAMQSPVLDRLLHGLEAVLEEAGLPVRDAWLVGEQNWRNAYCLDHSCCPPHGRPLAEVRDSRLNAELVFRGSSIGAAPGTAEPYVLPAPGMPAALQAEAEWGQEFSGRWRDRAQFEAVLDVWERVLEAAARPAAPAEAPAVTAPPAKIRSATARPANGRPAAQGKTTPIRGSAAPAAGAGALPAGLAGYLRATLRVSAWRDAVLVMAAAGRPAAVAGAEGFGLFEAGPGSAAPLPELAGFPPAAARAGAPAAPGYGDVLLGLEPPVPDWPRLSGLDRVFMQLTDCGGGEARAAALTGRGWIEWCRGRGSYADALFTAAAVEEPGYRLAGLLAELVRRGTLCGWARRKDSAWQKFDPDAA